MITLIKSTLREVETHEGTYEEGNEAIKVDMYGDGIGLTQKDFYYSPTQGEVNSIILMDKEQTIELYNILHKWMHNGS